MRLSRLLASVCATGLCAFAVTTAAFAQDAGYTYQTPSEQYLALRRVSPPRPGLTLTTLAQEPLKYRGATLEVTGNLVGIIRAEEGARLMLNTPQYGTLTLFMSVVPSWVQPGARLRALVVATADDSTTVSMGIPDFAVVAVASAMDIEAAEAKWRQQDAARKAAEKKKTTTVRVASGRLGSAPPRYRGSLSSRSGSTRGINRATFSLNGLSPAGQSVFPAYLAFIQKWNPRLPDGDANAITFALLEAAEKMDVDPRLVVSVIIAESDFRPNLTSHTGAAGLGQIMPGTARDVPSWIGLQNPYDPVQNVRGTVYLLKERLNKYSGGKSSDQLNMQEIVLALAAYNAGMGAVKKYGGVPPYRETQNYVKKIEKIYRRLCGEE